MPCPPALAPVSVSVSVTASWSCHVTPPAMSPAPLGHVPLPSLGGLCKGPHHAPGVAEHGCVSDLSLRMQVWQSMVAGAHRSKLSEWHEGQGAAATEQPPPWFKPASPKVDFGAEKQVRESPRAHATSFLPHSMSLPPHATSFLPWISPSGSSALMPNAELSLTL